MGSSGKHGHSNVPHLRTILISSTLALTVIATTAWALVVTGAPKDRPAAAAENDLVGRTPDRAARDNARTPLATPSVTTPVARKLPARKAVRAATTSRHTHRLRVLSSGVCQASFYGSPQATASGEPFNPGALTAAHKTLPMGSKVRVTNRANGRSVIVRINDRGPYAGGRCLDLSTAAMKAVGGVGAGVITARYEVLAQV